MNSTIKKHNRKRSNKRRLTHHRRGGKTRSNKRRLTRHHRGGKRRFIRHQGKRRLSRHSRGGKIRHRRGGKNKRKTHKLCGGNIKPIPFQTYSGNSQESALKSLQLETLKHNNLVNGNHIIGGNSGINVPSFTILGPNNSPNNVNSLSQTGNYQSMQSTENGKYDGNIDDIITSQ